MASLLKLAAFLVAEGVVGDTSHEDLRILLREESVTLQRLTTWKTSKDPDYAVKKARVEHLYAIADSEVLPEDAEPEVVFCLDEFGPLNLQPHLGCQWAAATGPRPRALTATQRGLHRPRRVRLPFAAYDLGNKRLEALGAQVKRRPTSSGRRHHHRCRKLRTSS